MKIITVKYERYSIKSRAAALGITLTELLAEVNKVTGYKMRMPDFTQARQGKDRSPSAEYTLNVADQILSVLEAQQYIKTHKGEK